jgi:chromosome segregation ATPase
MDVRLQNAYVEVLLSNFLEVVKQNIMFQAQLELSKADVNEASEIKRKIQELSKRNEELQQAIAQKESQSTNAISQEKNRLQQAVNDYMRQLEACKSESSIIKGALAAANKHREELTKYVAVLEQNVPANKLKKLKLGDDNKALAPEQPTQEDVVKSGGSF